MEQIPVPLFAVAQPFIQGSVQVFGQGLSRYVPLPLLGKPVWISKLHGNRCNPADDVGSLEFCQFGYHISGGNLPPHALNNGSDYGTEQSNTGCRTVPGKLSSASVLFEPGIRGDTRNAVGTSTRQTTPAALAGPGGQRVRRGGSRHGAGRRRCCDCLFGRNSCHGGARGSDRYGSWPGDWRCCRGGPPQAKRRVMRPDGGSCS